MEETKQEAEIKENKDAPEAEKTLETKEDYLNAFKEAFSRLRSEPIAEAQGKLKELDNDEEIRKIRKRFKKSQSEKDRSEGLSDVASRLTKYLNDVRKTLEDHSQARTTFLNLKTDKDKYQQENAKLMTARSRLEGLSKSLQKQNQDYLENHKRVIEDEKAKRQQMADSFQKKIQEICNKLEEKNLARQQKIKENEILKEKSKEVEHHYDTREVLFSTEMKKKELENQIHETQLEQKLLMIENESNSMDTYREQLDKAKDSERIVSEKLKIYLDKCTSFQDLMQLSNDSFVKFKKDMDKLTTKIKNIDTNNINTQKKIEKSDITVIELLKENKKLQKDLGQIKSQTDTFTTLLKRLEENISAKQAELKSLN